MAVQFGVLAWLAQVVGLGVAGWLTGALYAVATWLLLSRALRRSGLPALGAANRVTLARATLGGGVAALVAESFRGHVSVPALVALGAVALILDGVDGQVARRTGTSSALGARFDMEVDALLIMVLSVFVARSVGWWVLGIGALRYGFVAAAWALPWMRAPLPPRFSRKVVAAVQGVVLMVAAAGVLPALVTVASVALALALLCWSFAGDLVGLWQARSPRWTTPSRHRSVAPRHREPAPVHRDTAAVHRETASVHRDLAAAPSEVSFPRWQPPAQNRRPVVVAPRVRVRAPRVRLRHASRNGHVLTGR